MILSSSLPLASDLAFYCSLHSKGYRKTHEIPLLPWNGKGKCHLRRTAMPKNSFHWKICHETYKTYLTYILYISTKNIEIIQISCGGKPQFFCKSFKVYWVNKASYKLDQETYSTDQNSYFPSVCFPPL